MSVCFVIAVLAACTDATGVPSTNREPVNVSATPSKQGPTNSRIVYVRGDVINGGSGDVYTMDDDGTNVIQLTFTAATEFDATWAPDGKRIMYTSDPDGRRAVYIMNGDGSGVTRITNPLEGQADRHPRALGKRIVFTRFDFADRYTSLWVMNDDGTNLTRLTRGAPANHPAPAPSGKLVAFIWANDVWVIDVETGAMTNLTNTADGFEVTPSWSPNGKQIAYTVEELGGNQDIWVMNADGTEATQLTDTPTLIEFNPRWSPDGKRLAFTANYAPEFGIWSMFADGAGLNHLSQSHTPFRDEVPTGWAP